MFDKHRHSSYFPFHRPTKDLLFDQRKGKFLTFDEKERLKKYASEQRKKNLNK
jgi:hypothetical protein